MLVAYLPTPSAQAVRTKAKFEFNLEALRGLAAIVVVLTHCFGFSAILNGADRAGIWQYEFPGHLAVLVFFILSGYVIGLATKKQLTWTTTGDYLKKRILRLYPVYALCLGLSLLVTKNHYSLGAILSNFTFLQQVTAPAFYEVGMSWSLNCEIVFYLLFIPVSIYAVRPRYALGVTLLVALFFQFVYPQPLLAMYACGFCFWLVGLGLAQGTWARPRPASRYTLVGLGLLMLAFSELNFAREVMQYQLHLDDVLGRFEYSPVAVRLSDFSYLPLGMLLIAAFTNKRLRGEGLLLLFTVVTPLLYAYTIHRQQLPLEEKLVAYCFYFSGTVAVLIGAFRRPQQEPVLPAVLVRLGSISYGVYLVHFLIILAMGSLTMLRGTAASLLARSLLTVLATVLVAYGLEKRWHPYAVAQLKRLQFFQ